MAKGSQDLIYRFIAKDVNCATHFDVLADCLGEISDSLRKASIRLRDLQIRDEAV